jgi:Tubulin-tyrosine ligase family
LKVAEFVSFKDSVEPQGSLTQ